MKIRKQVYELTLEDLDRVPVWEFALDEEGEKGQDEATVRPVKLKGPLDPTEGTFIVQAAFTLADGTEMKGYLTPPVQSESSLGRIQPIIITERGQVLFWRGAMKPLPEDLARSYKLLGKHAAEVFPLNFRSQIPLTRSLVSGTLPGFLVLEDFKTGKVTVLQ
ncbi:MAG: hypothetical protein JWR07_5007 [Nevskia sp.]|nr:hypothetical protein [Nevskia sp.]